MSTTSTNAAISELKPLYFSVQRQVTTVKDRLAIQRETLSILSLEYLEAKSKSSTCKASLTSTIAKNEQLANELKALTDQVESIKAQTNQAHMVKRAAFESRRLSILQLVYLRENYTAETTRVETLLKSHAATLASLASPESSLKTQIDALDELESTVHASSEELEGSIAQLDKVRLQTIELRDIESRCSLKLKSLNTETSELAHKRGGILERVRSFADRVNLPKNPYLKKNNKKKANAKETADGADGADDDGNGLDNAAKPVKPKPQTSKGKSNTKTPVKKKTTRKEKERVFSPGWTFTPGEDDDEDDDEVPAKKAKKTATTKKKTTTAVKQSKQQDQQRGMNASSRRIDIAGVPNVGGGFVDSGDEEVKGDYDDEDEEDGVLEF